MPSFLMWSCRLWPSSGGSAGIPVRFSCSSWLWSFFKNVATDQRPSPRSRFTCTNLRPRCLQTCDMWVIVSAGLFRAPPPPPTSAGTQREDHLLFWTGVQAELLSFFIYFFKSSCQSLRKGTHCITTKTLWMYFIWICIKEKFCLCLKFCMTCVQQQAHSWSALLMPALGFWIHFMVCFCNSAWILIIFGGNYNH